MHAEEEGERERERELEKKAHIKDTEAKSARKKSRPFFRKEKKERETRHSFSVVCSVQCAHGN